MEDSEKTDVSLCYSFFQYKLISMQTLKEQISIAERLWIPIDTQAILWDMDGVLIDSLSLDLVVCNQLLKQHFGMSVKTVYSLDFCL